MSLLAAPGQQCRVEADVVGREGMVGLPVVLGADAELHELPVQADMQGRRLPSDALRRVMADSPALCGALLRRIRAFVANTVRRLDERLARWLQTCRDRLDGNDLPLTQRFLWRMLGANRPGATLALRSLKNAGLIGRSRGRVTVPDRAGLEAAADKSHEAPEAEYARLAAFGNENQGGTSAGLRGDA